ncbi:MAG: NAD-dependent epimerase/dehydratase family protein [Cyclobacteriaceae bacterium]
MSHSKITGSTILVTGGAGFVGSHVVEELLKNEPVKVIIIDNMIRGSYRNMESFIKNPRVEFIEGDIRNLELMEKIISPSDYCFHLAALRITRCAGNPVEAHDVMVNAMFNLVELARKYNIKKIIYSSSASVYGLAQNFPTPETDHPYDNKTFYGAAKTYGEQLLRSYKDMYDLDYIALRYFNLYGPRMDTEGKYTEVMIRWLDCIRDGNSPLIFGDGSTTMDFVHVEDIAQANIAALESDVTDEVFNIGNQQETSLKELLDVLLKVNNSSLQPQFREERKVNPVNRRKADISKAKDLLGFQPGINLEEGIKKLSEWYFSLKN